LKVSQTTVVCMEDTFFNGLETPSDRQVLA
jgi:hypothetical protein